MYYAVIRSESIFPALVMGWDWDKTSPTGTPQQAQAASGFTLVPLPSKNDTWLTDPQRWECQYQVDASGTLSTAPAPVTPLKDQAQAALQNVQQQASMVSAMGETFGPQTRDYVTKIRAIINGSDTTSTTLPQTPTNWTA